ncbi:DUF924 family protein [Mangrovicoccus algicola]|uniref:DUF924 domain-containing protein n=1 Tax=Mangrovicoccus algicola TaxID=2771008 RepID=A0A8J6Z0Q7_9RHOB|nr:DUF924 family protein [Mangrovicoccus algicola]MBE3640504.1 DUF924 domain-containing protein [Mangrovicoccus algicola]
MTSYQDVLDFWIEEVGPAGWYRAEDAIDATIRNRFGAAWHMAQAGGLPEWSATPEGTLALLILLDQFPRNMFRGEGRAFSSDAQARAVAKKAVEKGWDLRIPEPQRQFFYLPLMHSECLIDQERCIRLMMERMPETGADNLLHARAHREVIRRFGRFPHRNPDLDRNTTAEEARFLEEGGYGQVVQTLRQAA